MTVIMMNGNPQPWKAKIIGFWGQIWGQNCIWGTFWGYKTSKNVQLRPALKFPMWLIYI